MKGRGIKGNAFDLVVSHLPLVNAAAARVQQYLARPTDLDYVIADGLLALHGAVEEYAMGTPVDFVSYAKQRIRGAILDGLKKRHSAPGSRLRQPQGRAQKLPHALACIPAELKLSYEFGLALFHLHNASSLGGVPQRRRSQKIRGAAEASGGVTLRVGSHRQCNAID